MTEHKKQNGQILIILALAFVAILGMTALGVDGSMVLNEKRKDQSTADSAALAAAGAAAQYLKTSNISAYSCGSSLAANAATIAVTTAQNTASEDAVVLVANDLTASGVTTNCGVENGRKYLEITVRVTTQAPTAFLKVVYPNPISSVASAVSRVYVNTAFAGGNAIYTTGTTCSETNTGGGIFVHGASVIKAENGGIYSSSCLSSEGSAKILVYDGVIQYYGRGTRTFYTGPTAQTTTGNGLLFATNAPNFILNDPDTSSGQSIESIIDSQGYQLWSNFTPNSNIDYIMWPAPANQPIPAEMEPIVLPSCTGLSSRSMPTQTSGTYQYTAQPGIYSSISWSGWGSTTKLTFSPGIYCVDGGVSFGGGNSDHLVVMDNVVFYLRNNGSFSFGGNYKDFTLNNSSIFLNNGNFALGSGIPISANNFMTYIKQGNFSVSGRAKGLVNAPGCNTSACGVGPSIPGVLVYMAPTNTGTVTLEGSGTLSMTGTVYAPNNAVYVSGASSANTMNVQIIGRMVSVTGSGVINMDQDIATLYSQGSTTIQMFK